MQKFFGKNKKIFIVIIFAAILFWINPVLIQATDPAPTPPAGTTTPTKDTKPGPQILVSPIAATTVPELIGYIIKAVLAMVGALALLMFIYGGFTWLTSGGSPDRIKKGKDILMWATIGLAVIFASYTLVDFTLKAFGI